jgi:hypothetical protein
MLHFGLHRNLLGTAPPGLSVGFGIVLGDFASPENKYKYLKN